MAEREEPDRQPRATLDGDSASPGGVGRTRSAADSSADHDLAGAAAAATHPRPPAPRLACPPSIVRASSSSRRVLQATLSGAPFEYEPIPTKPETPTTTMSKAEVSSRWAPEPKPTTTTLQILATLTARVEMTHTHTERECAGLMAHAAPPLTALLLLSLSARVVQVCTLGVFILTFVWVFSYLGGMDWVGGRNFFNGHPFFMLLGVSVFLANGVLSWRDVGRVLGHTPTKAIHAGFNLVGGTCIALGLFVTIKAHTGPHFMSLHSWIALASAAMLALQLLGGLGFFSLPICPLATRVRALPLHGESNSRAEVGAKTRQAADLVSFPICLLCFVSLAWRRVVPLVDGRGALRHDSVRCLSSSSPIVRTCSSWAPAFPLQVAHGVARCSLMCLLSLPLGPVERRAQLQHQPDEYPDGHPRRADLRRRWLHRVGPHPASCAGGRGRRVGAAGRRPSRRRGGIARRDAEGIVRHTDVARIHGRRYAAIRTGGSVYESIRG